MGLGHDSAFGLVARRGALTWLFWVRACDKADELGALVGAAFSIKYTFELDSPYIDVSDLLDWLSILAACLLLACELYSSCVCLHEQTMQRMVQLCINGEELAKKRCG